MSDIKDALSEINRKLETLATHLSAMEEVLVARQLISFDEVDSRTGVQSAPHINARNELANLRHLIYQISD